MSLLPVYKALEKFITTGELIRNKSCSPFSALVNYNETVFIYYSSDAFLNCTMKNREKKSRKMLLFKKSKVTIIIEHSAF